MAVPRLERQAGALAEARQGEGQPVKLPHRNRPRDRGGAPLFAFFRQVSHHL